MKESKKIESMYLEIDLSKRKKPLKETLWYSYFSEAADKSKRSPIWEITSLKNESQEDIEFILEKLNSMSKSNFFITEDGFLASKNYYYFQCNKKDNFS